MDYSVGIMVLECVLVAFFAGLVFGLFGSGSGLVMMPGYYYILRHFTLVHSHHMQVAVATTAAVTGVLGFFSSRRQYRSGQVDFSVVRKLIPGLTLGSLAAIAGLYFAPSTILKKAFGVIVVLVAVWLASYRPERDRFGWSLTSLWHFFRSIGIALLWFMLGVAVFLVPYLHKCGLPVRRAVGTASFVATIYSAFMGIAFMIAGYFVLGIGHGQLGYVSIALFLASLIPSSLGGSWGARLSLLIPSQQLKWIYAALVAFVGALMLV